MWIAKALGLSCKLKCLKLILRCACMSLSREQVLKWAHQGLMFWS